MLLVVFRAGDLYLSSDISSFSGCISFSYCYPASSYVTMKNKNTCKVAQMHCVVISHWIWGQKLANLLVLSTSGSPAGQMRRPHTSPPAGDWWELHLQAATRQTRFSLLNLLLSVWKMLLPFEPCWFIHANFCFYFYRCLELKFTET